MMNTFPVGSLADVNPEAALAPSLSAQQVLASSAPQLHAWAADPVQHSSLSSAVASMNPEQVAQLSEGQVSALGDNLMGEVTKALTNADLVQCIASSGPAGLAMLRAMTPARIETLHPAEFNGLLTSRHDAASVMLNPGAPGAWSDAQFRAMVSKSMGDLPPRVLGKVLSAQALQSLTQADIAKLSGTQLRALLANPVLSKIIFNAGGKGGWTAGQLQALTPQTLADLTPEDKVQFVDPSVFTQHQKNAMTSQADNSPTPLNGLPGGGCGPSREQRGSDVNQAPSYYAQMDRQAVQAFLRERSGTAWMALAARPFASLQKNPYLRDALVDLVREDPLFLAPTAGFGFVQKLAQVKPEAVRNLLTQDLVDRLLQVGPEGIKVLHQIARNVVAALPDLGLTQQQVATLSQLPVGLETLRHVALQAAGKLPDQRLTSDLFQKLFAYDPEHASQIAFLAPDAMPSTGFTSQQINHLIDGGERLLLVLPRIATEAPATLPGGAFSVEHVNRLIAAGKSGLETLIYIAQLAPNALPGGQLHQEHVDSLIATREGLSALTSLARYAIGVLPDGRLTAGQIDRLITDPKLEKIGVSTLANIARLASSALPDHRLTIGHVDLLLGSDAGIRALVQIAIDAPASLPAGGLTHEQIQVLEKSGDLGEKALEKIKNYYK